MGSLIDTFEDDLLEIGLHLQREQNKLCAATQHLLGTYRVGEGEG